MSKLSEIALVQKATSLGIRLRYELSDGVHTKHLCKECGERYCRNVKCFMCLIKEFVDESN